MLGQSRMLSSLSEYGGQVYLAVTQLFNSKDKKGFFTQQGTELFRAEGELCSIGRVYINVMLSYLERYTWLHGSRFVFQKLNCCGHAFVSPRRETL